MSKPQSRSSSIIQFLLIFAVVYLGTQLLFEQFLPDRFGGNKNEVTGVSLTPQDATVKGQHYPVLIINNKSDQDLILEDLCPLPPVKIWKVGQDGVKTELQTEETATPCVPLTEVKAGESAEVSLAPWLYSLFNDYGTYEVQLPVPEGTQVAPALDSQLQSGVVTRFSVYDPGVLTQLFRTFITKPLLNLLIIIASVTWEYNLGIAIIILTLIVKLVLFFPTQHAMEGQRKMQLVQPKMDELRAKHKENPKKLQEETMKLWKENKVNPMQSCLPMLIQFPVLIGLFFVIRDGSVLALSQHLLYGPHANLTWTFGMHFLWMDLAKPNIIVMPALLVLLQFFQMKLSFAMQKKKQVQPEKKEKQAMSQQEVQQKVMMYGLPFMIGFFALQFPAAVSLYWAVSTVFAIVQQLFVNRKNR